MRTHQFLNVVPKPVKVAASLFFCCAVIIGPVVGFMKGTWAGPGLGLFLGAVIAVWLLCLGYVYADARRRAMPAVLWVVIAILVPNLLGFLLYFALRRPIASPCAHCGQPVAATQRFCSWCGSQGFAVPSSEGGSSSPGSNSGLAVASDSADAPRVARSS